MATTVVILSDPDVFLPRFPHQLDVDAPHRTSCCGSISEVPRASKARFVLRWADDIVVLVYMLKCYMFKDVEGIQGVSSKKVIME
jgi:hypothetical protein